MINFRFHVVSLIAIFLALALGVVIGAGVIDRGVVDTLNSRLDSVESKSDRIQAENRALSDRNDQQSNMIGSLQPFAVSGRLLGDDVGVVAVRGVDGDRVSAVVTAAGQADAHSTGTLWLEGKWALSDQDSVKALQQALGTTTKNKESLRTEALQQLAERLAAPESRSAGGDDLLTVLQKAGFLGYDGVNDSKITDFPGRSAGIVMVVGNGADVDPGVVTLPAAKALHAVDVPLVVASVWTEVTDGPERADAVQPIRDDDLAKSVSTVDDLDLAEGPTTVVLALSDLFLTPPVVGHYGYGPNASPLPDPNPAEPVGA
jgi:Copper transport outer membrane protein, MctB